MESTKCTVVPSNAPDVQSLRKQYDGSKASTITSASKVETTDPSSKSVEEQPSTFSIKITASSEEGLFSIDRKIPVIPDRKSMEHIFLIDPIGKLPEKPVCLKRLSSLTGWDFSTGLFRSIHIYDIFPFFPILWEMESACSERDFPIEIFAFHLHSLKPDGFLM